MTLSLYPTPFYTYLITQDRKPTPALLELLSICALQHDGSLENIIALTQKEQPEGFLRPKDKERWQAISYLADKAKKINTQCQKLNMLNEIKPIKNTYDYIILFGGTIEGVRSRLGFLINLWHAGIRGKKIIVLTGQRFLDPIIESKEILMDTSRSKVPCKKNWTLSHLPTTETAMIHMVFEQSIVPDAWHDIPIIFIDTPQKEERGTWVRPNTIDTIYHWLSTQPSPGLVLAISEQPSIGYQDTLLRRFLPASFTIETIGPALSASQNKPEILIGTIGWWLYHADHISKNN